MHNFLITTARRKFVRGWYDENVLFEQLSNALQGETDKLKIVRTVIKCLDETLEIENIAFLLAERSNPNQLPNYILYDSHSLAPIRTLTSHYDVIQHITTQIKKPALTKGLPENIAHALNIQEDGIIIPLSSPEILEGVIILGERSAGIAFSDADLHVFERLMNYVDAILYRLTPYDLLEKKFLENKEKLHQAEIQLVRAQKIEAIAHATRQCHHEIKTPLSILKLGIGEINNMQELEEFKTIAAVEIDKAVEIVNETMAITDIAKPSQQKEFINMNEVLQRCLKIIPESGYSLKTDLQLDLPGIEGNLRDIEVVFTNLITNAKDAMPDGGTLNITSVSEDSGVVVRISDTGKGIPDELKQIVWEPYTSGHRSDAGNETAGRGWGLTIVHRIVTEYDGIINFDSEVGVGTTFTVRFPCPAMN